MAPTAGGSCSDMALGAALQCVEAATLGMPFEVWKTRMGRFRSESTLEAFRNVRAQGGGSLGAFWQGTSAKMVESSTKGAVLVFAKEALLNAFNTIGVGDSLAGFGAGAGAGVCQVAVMGPCTFVVTALVTGGGNQRTTSEPTSAASVVRRTWQAEGLKGFYPGGSAIALRQATNWASRQGFTDSCRVALRRYLHGDAVALRDSTPKLTNGQEAACGVVGGALACWNHPFEVLRVQMQAAAAAGEERVGLATAARRIAAHEGVAALFQGVVPRIGLGIWQTLFMVVGVRAVKESWQQQEQEKVDK